MLIGPRLSPLSERMGHDRFDGEVLVSRQHTMHISGGTHEISEQELLDNYFDFLADVRQTAEQDSSKNGEVMHEMAERFARDSTYLSVADARAAVRGLGTSQADYLLANQDRQLFLFVPKRSAHKSQGKFADDMESYIGAVAPDVAERVHIVGKNNTTDIQMLGAADPSLSKIVLLDDWSVTGNQIANEVGYLQQYLEIASLGRLRSNLEVNLLLIRADQIHDGFRNLNDVEATYNIHKHIPMRAFFTSKAIKQHAGPMPTGAHSAVDYGFQSQIAQMRDYLATETADHELLLPYIATVRSHYAEEY